MAFIELLDRIPEAVGQAPSLGFVVVPILKIKAHRGGFGVVRLSVFCGPAV